MPLKRQYCQDGAQKGFFPNISLLVPPSAKIVTVKPGYFARFWRIFVYNLLIFEWIIMSLNYVKLYRMYLQALNKNACKN